MTEKTFTCDNEGMMGAQAFLESVCEAPKPGIVMDEIVSNIVRCSGAKAFTVGLDQTGEGLAMVFSDNGVAFDPTQDAEAPNLSSSLDDRSVGGLGIFMVKKMAKSVEYRRENDRNVLKVVM